MTGRNQTYWNPEVRGKTWEPYIHRPKERGRTVLWASGAELRVCQRGNGQEEGASEHAECGPFS